MALTFSHNPLLTSKRLAVGIPLFLIWILLFRGTLFSLYNLSMRDSGHSHLLAVPFLAAFFFFTDRREIFDATRANPRLQSTLVILFTTAGLLLYLISVSPGYSAQYPDALSLAAVAAVFLFLGIFLGVFNGVALRSFFFPGLILLLLIPIPVALREMLVAFLVKGTAALTEVLFRLTGTSFYREGGVFLLPGISIEIADVCSGIRSSIGLLITILVAGHLFLKRVWSKVTLVVLVIPLVLVKNALRVAGLTLLSIYVDRSYLESSLHHTYGGMVFFALTLFVFLIPILLLLRKLEKSTGGRSKLKISIK
jgi:exosortase